MDRQPDPFNVDLGALLRRLRLHRNISQEYVATAIGLERTSITNIEAGRQGLTAHKLVELLAVLGMGLLVIED